MKTSRLALVVLTVGLLCAGNAVGQDEKKTESDGAVGLFENNLAKAKNGDTDAMVSLGLMYQYGEGVIEDDKEAVKWFRKAAELGEAYAMVSLGFMYQFGGGVIEDDKEAVKWFRKAAERGDTDAMVSLGLMYDNGEGVIEDDKEAVKWFRKAAELGEAGAMVNLGLMYQFGEGVIEDAVEAYGWFNVAAANGYKQAAELREKIKIDMTREQIVKGQKRSREIMKSIAKE